MSNSQVQSADYSLEFNKMHSEPLSQMHTAQDRKKRFTAFSLLWILLAVSIISLSMGAVPISACQTIAIIGNTLGVNLPWEYMF